MSFGERLKEARTLRGLTQKQLAEKLNIGSTTVTGYEKDNSEPNMLTISKIMEILEVDANFLFQDETKELYKNETTPEEFENIIKKYRIIAEYSPDGADVVDMVLDRECEIAKKLKKQTEQLQEKDKRIAELEAVSPTVVELPSQLEARHLVEYFRNTSAGSGIFILGNEAASRIAVADQDWDDRTDYVIRVNGDSMAPDYNDGDDVLVSQHIELRHGDVGIFIVNGSSFIKEYGENELISRNPAFQNIQVHEFDNIVCMGKVIGTIRGEYQVIND